MDTTQNFPGVLDRVKAIVADGIITIIFMFIAYLLFSLFDNVADSARMIVFIFIFVLYDPIFTSAFGCTIGHKMMGIMVKRKSDESKNIIFPLAILRFIIKFVLGIISLLTVSTNKKRNAIHDLIVGSVVLYAKPPQE